MMFPEVETSLDYFFNTCFISIDSNMYYISFNSMYNLQSND